MCIIESAEQVHAKDWATDWPRKIFESKSKEEDEDEDSHQNMYLRSVGLFLFNDYE